MSLVSLRSIGMIALLLFQSWLGAWAAGLEPRVYLLAQPIEQTTELSRGWSLYHQGSAAAWGIAEPTLLYIFQGVETAIPSAVYQVTTAAPRIAALTRAQLELQALYRRRKNFQEIANTPGASLMRVMTTSKAELRGVTTGKLESRTFVFLETDQDLSKTSVDRWIPLDDLERKKLRLNLHIFGQEPLPPVEIPLKELFEGVPTPAAAHARWAAGLREWERSLPWWDRVLKRSAGTALKIDATLIDGAEEFELGALTEGARVNKFVKGTPLERAKNWVREKRGLPPIPPILSTVSIPVHSVPCAPLFQRMMGRAFNRQ